MIEALMWFGIFILGAISAYAAIVLLIVYDTKREVSMFAEEIEAMVKENFHA